MRKIKIAILTFILAFVPMTSGVYATFPDVPSTHTYYDAINYVQEEGIVDGFTDGSYRPDQTITRAEFTKIIINVIYSPMVVGEWEICQPDLSDGLQYIYPDIGESNLFYEYVCIAEGEDIVGGYSNGNFYPDNPITMGEASKIISNAYGFTDLESGPEGDVFKPFVDELAERNAIPYTILDIDDNLLRGEMAAFIYYLDTEADALSGLTYEDIKWDQYSSTLLGIDNQYSCPRSWTHQNEDFIITCTSEDGSAIELTGDDSIPNLVCEEENNVVFAHGISRYYYEEQWAACRFEEYYNEQGDLVNGYIHAISDPTAVSTSERELRVLEEIMIDAIL